jgi:hypothetical protein
MSRHRHDGPIPASNRAGQARGFQPLDSLPKFRNVGWAVPTVLGLIAILLCGCSAKGRPDPKDAVKNMFEAMRTSDSVALAANVDLRAAAGDFHSSLAGPGIDTADQALDWGALLLKQMTGEGELRKRWLTDNQIVLGRSEITGDSAFVEVSFLDRVTRVQYYNKMRLAFRGDHWVVTDFRTM